LLLTEVNYFMSIIKKLTKQTTQIGLVSSSLSYIRQSEYENSLETSLRTDSNVPPSNEYPISIDNSEKNRTSTIESDILSRTDSMNVENETFKFDNRDNLLPLDKQMKMHKKREGEYIYMQIDSQKRRKTDTSASYIGSLAVSKFEEGVMSPKSHTKGNKTRETKLYLKKR